MTRPQSTRPAVGALALVLAIAACATASGCLDAFVPKRPADRSDNPSSTAARARPTDEAAASSQAPEDRCRAGGPNEVVQARIGVQDQGKFVAWTDVEIQGPQYDALRACQAILAEEQRQLASLSATLTATVLRPCSTQALAPVPVGPGAMLVDDQVLSPVDLLLLLGGDQACGSRPALARPDDSAAAASAAESQPPRPAVELAAVAPTSGAPALRATHVRLSSFDSMTHCQAALASLLAARAKAQQGANASARQWLDQALKTEEAAVEAACRGSQARSSEPCRKEQAVLTVVRDHLAQLASDPVPSEPPLPGPVCRVQ